MPRAGVALSVWGRNEFETWGVVYCHVCFHETPNDVDPAQERSLTFWLGEAGDVE